MLCMLAASLCACGNRASEKQSGMSQPKVAVSVAPLERLASTLMGDSASVVTLIPPSADPETYEPTLATMKGLAESEVYFSLSTPGFERNVERMLPANFPSLESVDLSKGIKPLYDHSHGGHGHRHAHGQGEDDHAGHSHEGEEPDPHYLTSVRNVIVVVREMAGALANRWPERTGGIMARRDSLLDELNRLDHTLDSLFSAAPSRRIAVTHPSLGYLARDYGLTQVTLSGGTREMTPREYAEALGQAGKVGLLLTDLSHDPTRAAEASRQLGIPLMTLDLNSGQWLESLRQIAVTLQTSKTDQ